MTLTPSQAFARLLFGFFRNSLTPNDLDTPLYVIVKSAQTLQAQTGELRMPPSDERPVVAVRVCADDSEADVVMALLRDRGIESFSNSQLSHRILPVAAGRLGEVTVYVDESKADTALKVIEESGAGS